MNTATAVNIEIQRATRNPISQEESPMAFVNEFVSEEDIKKYDLDDLMKSYSSWSWRDGRPGGFTHAWTIDRERDIYFMPVKSVEEVGRSGRNEPTGRIIYVLNWQGRKIEVELSLSPESTPNIYMTPFRLVWELVEINPANLIDVSRDKVVQELKDALMTYGLLGVHRQVPNTIVEFKF